MRNRKCFFKYCDKVKENGKICGKKFKPTGKECRKCDECCKKSFVNRWKK